MVQLLLALILGGFQVTVTAPHGCHPCYVQLDGGQTDASFFQFDLAPGETFAHAVAARGSVRVRVWTETSGTDADADQTITAPYHTYLPV